MPHRWRALLTVSVGVVVATVVLSPAALAAPPACTEEPSATLAGAEGPQQGLMKVANPLAEQGELDAAEHLYELARTSLPVDVEAGTGLAYVQAHRVAAEQAVAAGEELAGHDDVAARACYAHALQLDQDNKDAAAGLKPIPTAAATASKQWDTFFARWVQPAGKV